MLINRFNSVDERTSIFEDRSIKFIQFEEGEKKCGRKCTKAQKPVDNVKHTNI